MKKETTGKAETSSRGREAITEISIGKIPRQEMTPREDAPEITEMRGVEVSSVHPKRE